MDFPNFWSKSDKISSPQKKSLELNPYKKKQHLEPNLTRKKQGFCLCTHRAENGRWVL
jgi:hypothetical protein